MRLGVLARVYCDYVEEDMSEYPPRRVPCDSYFDMELTAEVAPVSGGSSVNITFPVQIVAPPGWYVRHRAVRCSRHHRGLDEPTGKEVPTQAVLEKAAKLQALAMDKGATEGERAAAWKAFGDLWDKYQLPVGLGLEGI